ncbi:MAG: hypothetical protein DSM107014_03810 [Gomphosphaeria aponina SAG 52.96 = DSM 107014]|uniref:CARDB domain-containing protein n=1 Tax=Gomphosphaeria aponina SAG 52.96 = DSM 107014 TaxID=1521640 RepID=A0A941GQ73_9CHRO|nr:hypothetical protein [Gomphosphaeria aponina SAG 52.96 = DSM 107014]
MANVQKQGLEFRVNTTTEERQQNPAITSLTNGDFVVTWESVFEDRGWEIFGKRYDSNGNSVGEEFIVNTTPDGPQLSSSVSDLTGGGFVVTWRSFGQDGSDDGVFARVYDADGEPQGEEFQINTTTNDDQWQAKVTGLKDGGFVITWQSNGQDGSGSGIYRRRYNSDGQPVAEEIQVNITTEQDQVLPVISDLANGGFVVTWDSDGQDGSDMGVYGQVYAANGSRVGGEFRVNTTTDGSQSNSSVTDLADGGFVVSWQSPQDGEGTGIYAQRYDANNQKVGSEFRVNSTIEGPQTNAQIAKTTDGGFVVTWQSINVDEGDSNIFGQAYDANGNPLGGEFQVNTTTEENQWAPAVVGLPNEGFAIAWQSLQAGDNDWDIYGQRFARLENTTGELSPAVGFDVITEPQAAGNDVDVKFAVKNTAANGVGFFDVDFYISANDWISENDLFLKSYTIESLGGNSTVEEQTTLNLPGAGDPFWQIGDGTYYIGMIVDGKNTVTETNEDDNSNQGKFFSFDDVLIENTAPSDLAPQEFGFDVVNEPSSYEAGSNIDVLFTVQNTDVGNVGPFDVDFYISNNDWISEDDNLLGSYTVDGLTGNNTFSDTTSLALPGLGDSFWSAGSGTYYVGMIIDGKNTLIETNEGNNVNFGYFDSADKGKFTGWDDINVTLV